MAEPLVIDVAGAQAALDAAGGEPETIAPAGDPFRTPGGQFASRPTEPAPTPDAVPPADATPPTPVVEDTTPDFTSITDAAILSGDITPEQLVQMRRSMNADYTRKTQEAAPWRKLGEELGVQTPEDFRAAGEVYQRLQDPRNWPTIHGELSAYMQEYGMTPQQANVAAAEQLATFAPETTPAELPQPDEFSDPSVAPLMQALQAQQARLASLEASITGDREAQQQQTQWNAVAQHLTTQEQQIRAANPQYGEDEVAAIYNLMGPDGNLVVAQQKFESIIGAQLAKYIGNKGAAQLTTPVPPAGGQVLSAASPEHRMTMDEGHRAAMAHVAELDKIDATS